MEEDQTPILTRQPCPDCGGSDPLAIYEDHTFCFSCSAHHFTMDREEGHVSVSPKDWNPVWGETKALKSRGLNEETCKKFGYQVARYNGKTVQVATYKKNGKVVGQKIRGKNKEFSWIGEKKPPLFGQSLWKSKGRKLVITEGEIDCMTVSQLQDHKWPVVSIPSGCAGAKKALKNELEWIESFEEVILMFDMDEPGQEAAYKCAKLLSPGKARIAQLSMKDPNELLKANKAREIVNAIWTAKDYAPESIICMTDLRDKIEEERKIGLSYPWPEFSGLVDGFRMHELIVLGAGTGLGKTTLFRQLLYHVVSHHREQVGIMFSEETVGETAREILSLVMEKPLERVDISLEERMKSFDEFDTDKIHLMKNFLIEGTDGIIKAIRFLHLAKGVKYFFIDHLTALVTGGGNKDGERIALDNIMTHLRSLVTELDVTVFMISHLGTPAVGSFEEGAHVSITNFRGSRSIGHWPNSVFALERNQQDEDESKRHIAQLKILKHRPRGAMVGKSVSMKYDEGTGKLTEVEDVPSNPFKEIKERTNGFEDF